MGARTWESRNLDEGSYADLGALEARRDPESIFALQRAARLEARRAYVHLGCSRRVQRAHARNAIRRLNVNTKSATL